MAGASTIALTSAVMTASTSLRLQSCQTLSPLRRYCALCLLTRTRTASFQLELTRLFLQPQMKLDVRCVVCRKVISGFCLSFFLQSVTIMTQDIEGDALQVLGGLYHFTCFACTGCGNKVRHVVRCCCLPMNHRRCSSLCGCSFSHQRLQVGTDEFFDRDNKPYCVSEHLWTTVCGVLIYR
jgi:hypothetical protein